MSTPTVSQALVAPFLAAAFRAAVNAQLQTAGLPKLQRTVRGVEGLRDGRWPALAVEVQDVSHRERYGGRLVRYGAQVHLCIALAAGAPPTLAARLPRYADIVRAVAEAQATSFQHLTHLATLPDGEGLEGDGVPTRLARVVVDVQVLYFEGVA